jgi:acetolactate synthase-1/2/3 large subunit
MGLGALDAGSKLNLGMLGMHGTYEANMAMHNSDVVLALGARFYDRVIGNPRDFEGLPRTVVQVDVDPSSISKCVATHVPIVGDVRDVLSQMVEQLEATSTRSDSEALGKWIAQIEKWRAKRSLAYSTPEGGAIKPQAVVERVASYTNNDAYYATDVGEHQMWAAQYLKLKQPRHWMTSGGLGTMGYGLPAAMGAAVAHPDEPVVLFTGDGSIQMCIQELATCKQYGLAPKIFLLNNGYLGMVAIWQEAYYGGRYSESVMDVQPDFVMLAQAYGHVGLRVRTYEELDQAIATAFDEKNKDKLVFVDVLIEPHEPVRPMVGPGQGLTEMVLAEEN